MMVLGAGFGLGVALGVSRLFAGLAPGLTIAGLVAGGVIGLLLTVWVVGMRGVLSDRAVLDRWINEVTAALQSTLEERVATRVLAAEAALTAEVARRDEADAEIVSAPGRGNRRRIARACRRDGEGRGSAGSPAAAAAEGARHRARGAGGWTTALIRPF